MPAYVIIAVSSAVYRKGLSSLFSGETEAYNVSEVETKYALICRLKTGQVDFVIVEQFLVRDMSILLESKFAVLAREPDKAYFLEAVACGARGYFLDTVSTGLIKNAMNMQPGQCCLDPALTPWLAGLLSESELVRCNASMLTPREREVLALKEQHLSTREIAERLCVSETTVKKHVQNILQKRRSGKYHSR